VPVRRAFVIVLDACGAGALPDAADYGDEGTNTLVHVAEMAGGLDVPQLQALGLGSIQPTLGVDPATDPVLHGRLHATGPGKDTISGHWELMGVVTPEPLRTYPDGFPDEVLDALREAWGRPIIGNVAASGTEIIDRLGPEQLETGAAIVYTSADSVLQIAAHENVIAVDELYAMCESARRIMTGEHAVGRVIARPYEGGPGSFRRTLNRHDYALTPPGRSYLEELQAAAVPVHVVGKVADVFDHVGIDASHPGADNVTAIAETTELVRSLDGGLVFTNLVDTDQKFGHRKDVEGFHGALRHIDAAVRGWLDVLDPANDLLVLTADHGVDPQHPGTDHTREHVPLLAAFAGHGGRRHDGPMSDVGASCLRWLAGRDAALPGTPFVP
jgi:phosphopentomutase